MGCGNTRRTTVLRDDGRESCKHNYVHFLHDEDDENDDYKDIVIWLSIAM